MCRTQEIAPVIAVRGTRTQTRPCRPKLTVPLFPCSLCSGEPAESDRLPVLRAVTAGCTRGATLIFHQRSRADTYWTFSDGRRHSHSGREALTHSHTDARAHWRRWRQRARRVNLDTVIFSCCWVVLGVTPVTAGTAGNADSEKIAGACELFIICKRAAQCDSGHLKNY